MLHVCVHIWLRPSNTAILGRGLEHLGSGFPIWPSYGWGFLDFEISELREIKMSQSTVIRTITTMLHVHMRRCPSNRAILGRALEHFR